MKRINLESINAEIADRIEELNIVINCACNEYAFVTDEEAKILEEDMPFADWFFTDVKEMCEYEDDDIAFAAEDDENIYIDLGTGLGVAVYDKDNWTIKEALADTKKGL